MVALSFFAAIPNIAEAQCTDAFLSFRTITLDEPDAPLGNPESAAVLANGDMAVATSSPAAVHLFDDRGRYIQQIGDQGSGPFEYQNPSIVRTDGSTVYVWDSEQLRLLAFDDEGREIDEWIHFSQALADFDVEEETLLGYRSGIRSGAFVSGQQIEDGEGIFATGEVTDEHVVLSFLDGSGTLRASQEHVYYASPARASIYAYDRDLGQTQTYHIEDGDFSVNEFAQNLTDRESIIDYVTENSRFYKLNVLADQSFLAALQHGSITYGDDGLSDFDRALNIHHVGEEGQAKGCEQIELDFESTGDDPIIGYTDNGFIFLETEQENGDLTYRIYLMGLDGENH